MTVPIAPGLSPSESQLLALLRAGVSRERAVAIGRHRATWTPADVDAMAAQITNPAEPDPPTITPDCGTRKGYRAHHKRGEKPRRPCLDAQNTYNRAYRAKGLAS